MTARGPVLVTGSAGFIGFHVANRLLARGETVIGLDNLNNYYDPALKQARLERLLTQPGYRHHTLDLADRPGMAALFALEAPRRIVHLGAQAGVRYSLEAPETYVDSNVVGFLTVLEGARAVKAEHLVFASTSSAFGANGALPFSVKQGVAHPLTVYAATKIANEAMAHSYSHLFGFPSTGLRFFTVYGPWGRPDMALFKFTKAILEGRPIDVYGHGEMERDFTFIDDIVDGVVAALDHPAAVDPEWKAERPDPSTSGVAPWRVLNLGAGRREPLMRYIQVLEDALGRKAELNLMPVQDGDVTRTEADVSETREALGYAPSTAIDVGVKRFVDWYRDFYRV
ncbi:MAG: NAD-dependent epimerase/dehydratase family protein [Brevundimonas sp.]|uniref:NAD-dependent epimerase/dehydratase family protein n=1 Tax=Brevundimonas sp. TaxID=1871086 RepID=UPI0024897758|nr:NAD-dependent epimerase/dehydratase family protein [Brevundimonas sp.]MDI1325549.1 NAD-dependent epimerase/dehydratase family protein [Brevundimonas sp.]